jgi:ATP-dependent Clp protease protease subunit
LYFNLSESIPSILFITSNFIVCRTALMADDRADDDALLAQRVVVLRGEIDDDLANEIVAKLLFVQAENTKRPMELWINSPGGRVTAGLAIMDTMEFVTNDVHTRCNGIAHGLAAILLACGERGHREIIRDAKLGLTPIVSIGSAHDADVKRLSTILVERLAKATGQDATAVAVDMESSRSFTPDEAVAYGLADRVVDW